MSYPAVGDPTATAFRTIDFPTVEPRLLPAFRDIWLRGRDGPLRNDDEAAVIREALDAQVRDLARGTFPYRVLLPALSDDEVRARGFDPRRAVAIGFAAELAPGTPAVEVPRAWAGRVALWRRGSHEFVFVESVEVKTRDPAMDPGAHSKARLRHETNVERLRLWLDAYEAGAVEGT